ncbi:hypothetical protein EHM76_04600 [bacterium]|nr:MAG: hypothetical protein EHM76_04600 [bacterium]
MAEYVQWLYDDVQQNRKIVANKDSQLARRNYLRSLYAFYEIALSEIREVAARLLAYDFDKNGEWELHKIFPLLDESARLNRNGKLDLEPNRMPFLPLVAYVLKTYAEEVGLEKDVLSDSRWKAFCDSTQIRHRITHPKFHTEIEITDDELQTIDSGLEWWNDICDELRNKHHAKLSGG